MDFSASRFEIPLELRRVVRVVVFAVQLQTNLSIWRQMLRQVVEEEFPLGDLPELVALVAVKTDHVGRDYIEFRTKIRQGLKCLDPPDFALHSKELNHFREARLFIEIQSKNVVAEVLANVEKISGTTSDIENAFAPTEVKTQVPHPLQIDFHPHFQVEVFGPGIARVLHGVPLINLLELPGVDRFHDPGGVESERCPSKNGLFHVTSSTRVGVAREDFLEFVGYPHRRVFR